MVRKEKTETGFIGVGGRIKRHYFLVFTNKRIIRALLVSFKKTFGIKLLTIDILDSWITGKLAEKKCLRLAELDPNDILKNDGSNISIPYMSVKSIELSRNRILGGKIKIKTKDKDYSFHFDKRIYQEVSTDVQFALPDNVEFIDKHNW